MKYVKVAAASIAIFTKCLRAYGACLPLITDGTLCADPPGTISSDGFDDVCNLVQCCNGGNTPTVELPSGLTILCLDANCNSICTLSNMRSSLANEACDSTCPPPNPCANPVKNTCNFYPDCLEAEYHCRPGGYPIGYGLKNCNKFIAALSSFSPNGQTWVTNTMLCLQQALVPDALSGQATCASIWSDAFASHAPCYVSSGVCSIPQDWALIFKLVGPSFFGGPDALLQVLETAAGCFELYTYLLRIYIG